MDEKGLTLEDTQGMFLLLAIGFVLAGAALISEWMGGCSRYCSLRKNTIICTNSVRTSRNTLIATPATEIQSEIKVFEDDDNDSQLHFGRETSGKSNSTLYGEIIPVTEDNIIVHNSFDANNVGSRRSSSPDVDKEVREIFEKDLHRRRFTCATDVTDISEGSESEANTKEVFGEHIN